MKNLFSLDDFIAAAISGIGYGLGYYVPERLGWHPVIALAVCMVSGGFLDYAVHRMLHRRFLQNSTAAKFLLVVFFVALLFAVNGLSYVYLGISLFGSYIECIIWVVAFELLGLAVSSVRKFSRKRRIRRKYGISPSLFVFSEKESNRIGVLNGENRKIDGDYDKSLAVQTITGTFVGKKKGGVVSYLGFPYASPPTGTLRW
ncbi:MAG: carboxylesterase family protein, partial [Sphaerochaetaceae bacterium]|nr:carboxylesterase family protein [Sphaerochaetaceae bacterium]